MKTYQNPQPQAVERVVKKQKQAKKDKIKSTQTKEEDRKLDKALKDTFPASDAIAEYK